jgi:hypothetical protein
MSTIFFYKSKYHQKKTRIMEKGSRYSERERERGREGEAKRIIIRILILVVASRVSSSPHIQKCYFLLADCYIQGNG